MRHFADRILWFAAQVDAYCGFPFIGAEGAFYKEVVGNKPISGELATAGGPSPKADDT